MIKVKEAHIGVIERENAYLKSFSPEKLKETYLSLKTQLEEQLSKAHEDYDYLSLSVMEEVNKARDNSLATLSTTIQKLELMTTGMEELRELIRHQSDNPTVSEQLEDIGSGKNIVPQCDSNKPSEL